MTIAELTSVMESIAPRSYAAEWDNVGLLIGAPDWPAAKIVLTIDLTDAVLAEAIDAGMNAIVAYHPPIFQPLRALSEATAASRIALRAARAGIAVYSPHTALDAAPGGVNDWLAAGLGEGDVRALDPVGRLPESEQYKIVTFCPVDAAEKIRNGLASVGAGRIGHYELCSFELRGTGTFFARDEAHPTIGRKGSIERVDEVRLEMVCPKSALALAVMSLRHFHPYEEPPIEIYQLHARPERNAGHGRKVTLDQRTPMETLVERVKERLGVKRVGVAAGWAGRADGPAASAVAAGFQVIAVCAGAGAGLLESAVAQGCELFFTGEMRHHDVLAAQAQGCTVLLAGHTNTERGYLRVLRERLLEKLPGTQISLSRMDAHPIKAM
jgi:dinuclear metal center YbgI/SA1388 family protein